MGVERRRGRLRCWKSRGLGSLAPHIGGRAQRGRRPGARHSLPLLASPPPGAARAPLLRGRGFSVARAVGVLENGDEVLELGVQSLLGQEETVQQSSNRVTNEAFDDVLTIPVGR